MFQLTQRKSKDSKSLQLSSFRKEIDMLNKETKRLLGKKPQQKTKFPVEKPQHKGPLELSVRTPLKEFQTVYHRGLTLKILLQR